jgi:hypothetical protein
MNIDADERDRRAWATEHANPLAARARGRRSRRAIAIAVTALTGAAVLMGAASPASADTASFCDHTSTNAGLSSGIGTYLGTGSQWAGHTEQVFLWKWNSATASWAYTGRSDYRTNSGGSWYRPNGQVVLDSTPAIVFPLQVGSGYYMLTVRIWMNGQSYDYTATSYRNTFSGNPSATYTSYCTASATW